MSRPRVLIEDWLPIAEVGVEAQRERGVVSALPPIYFLHVWWARRPLMSARAALLGAALPSWNSAWPRDLLDRFPDESSYHKWFKNLLGIRGNPVAVRELQIRAKADGQRSDIDYEGPRAFSLGLAPSDVPALKQLLAARWGSECPRLLDPMAGGGSIPFEGLRYGFTSLANELNPVASVILLGTLDYPARHGPSFARKIELWGRRWHENASVRLSKLFPAEPGEAVLDYIHVRTVPCPDTGKPVPLAPNWWLSTGKKDIALRPVAKESMDQLEFEIVVSPDPAEFDPSKGTVAHGAARSPWTGATITAKDIREAARRGELVHILAAVVVDKGNGKEYRLPTAADLEALSLAETYVREHKDRWADQDLIPTEPFPTVASDRRPLLYGMTTWADFFTTRQLASLVTLLEEMLVLEEEIREQEGSDGARAIMTYLAFALDKCADFNSMQCTWIPARGVVGHSFQRHDFAVKWSFAEMNFASSGSGAEWAVRQVAKAYRQLAELVEPSSSALFPDDRAHAADLVSVTRGDAADLALPDASVELIVVDPPYYDNVQYAELSDFFYVWEKRSVGHLYPEFFSSELTDKSREAVANPARFEALGKKKAKALAKADYEKKMTNVFAEAHRVLRDDGVLTVMFTHKKVEAWDTLGNSLIEAGFEIESSWPVHTESEYSLHQVKKAAAASTILLTCRKRTAEREGAWWDDLKGEVRQAAREKAEEFLKAGIEGVDLYISTFGPTLSVISREWPVFTSEVDPDTGEARPLRPEEALDLAREEVADLRRRGLLLGRDVEFDPVTDWYVLAWDAFRAVEFPYDEARKLALALGIDLEGELVKARVVSKKGSSVILQEPKRRRHPGLADPEESSFTRLIDAAHALMVVHQEDGIRGAEAFLKRTRLGSDARLHALLQALINAIPRTKQKGRFVRPEADSLDGIATGLSDVFADLTIPADPDATSEPEQGAFELESER